MSIACYKDYEIVVQAAPPVPIGYWALEEVAGPRINAVGDPNGDLAVGGPDPGNAPGIIGNGCLFIMPFEQFGSPGAALFNYNPAGPGISWTFWFQVNPLGFPVEVGFYFNAFAVTFVMNISDLLIRAEMQGLTTNSTATINQVWVPGQWTHTSRGWEWTPGYWK